MSGTFAGGKKAAAKNKALYGEDFYRVNGAIGGASGKTGGFAAGESGRARARKYGKIGGQNSTRRKTTKDYILDSDNIKKAIEASMQDQRDMSIKANEMRNHAKRITVKSL